ncbi:MAG TPA: DNA primase, partial [Desulfurococcales archaeon]|nr:DNA primase [Desulfurococcales archaeon]
MKYLIKAKFEVEGIVEKSDVIGAIFGQTEGLLGEEYDLRDLQDKGRIGRIQVDLKTQNTKTYGTITIPSNLDRVETALLAALIEIVDRIGPYSAKISVEEIIDLRAEKIKKIVNRAKDIL